jgi:glycosyltransferase involved in cell wall biosynthesis
MERSGKQRIIHAKISSSVALDRAIFGWNQKSLIGIVSPSYGTEKVSYGLEPEGFSYSKLLRVPIQRFESQGSFWKSTPVVLDHSVELVHTFNEIPIGMRPFVVSYENELPRYLGSPKKWQTEMGLNLLANGRCRAILALSEVAALTLSSKLLDLGANEICSKVSVFRGSIPNLPVNNSALHRRLTQSEPLRVLFVGRDAFGKGLLPALDALDDCRAQGALISATIVCGFEERVYISKGRCVDRLKVLERMQRQEDTTYHPLLSNQKIHELMRTHDVLIFPTLDESLGWVAVEASMAGIPVISTDVYALPELIVHGKTGYLIPLSKKPGTFRWSGLWLDGVAFDSEVASAFEVIRSNLVTYLVRFFENPALANSMGAAASEHMNSMYMLGSARDRIQEIYRNALG